ncbi:MAG: 2Fe-2S iron-sulfur cluster-binding protein, partial [Rubrivivax sp.]
MKTISLQLDGRTVQARSDQTLWEVAREQGIEIPHLCHTPGLEPAGNCRACVVEVEGERTLAASCCRRAGGGLRVQTASPRARSAQKMVLELLEGELGGPAPAADYIPDNEVRRWARALGV